MKCRLPRKKEVVITPTTVTLELSGIFNSIYGYATIGGTKYTSARTLTLEPGTEVTIFCSSNLVLNRAKCQITKDGGIAATGTTSDGATYTFVLTSNTSIDFTRSGNSSSNYYWSASITT